jgi:hypothetical protein
MVGGEMFKDIDGHFQPAGQWQLQVINEQGKYM